MMSKRLYLYCTIAFGVLLSAVRIYSILALTDGQTGALTTTNWVTGSLYVLLVLALAAGVVLGVLNYNPNRRFSPFTPAVSAGMLISGVLILLASVWQFAVAITGNEVGTGMVMTGILPAQFGAVVFGVIYKGSYLLGILGGISLILTGISCKKEGQHISHLHAGSLLLPVVWAMLYMLQSFLQNTMIIARPERLLPQLCLICGMYMLFCMARTVGGIQQQKGSKHVRMFCFFTLVLSLASVVPPAICSLILAFSGYRFLDYQNLVVLALGILAALWLFGSKCYLQKEEPED